MRMLRRNMQKAYYQLYQDKVMQLDTDGYMTGRPQETYGEKTAFWANIFQGTDYPSVQPYGIQDNDMVTLYMQSDLGFTDQTKLYIGNTETPNYIVTSVSKNINGITVKARKLK